ncbi:hypothetical protein [Variovorax soli]|uniref:Uncharacterized protein n=1 Tax=Variovorax soli TaxID=376815 RepID=A0ABU1NLL8_9BURK|nr:hypothetical protein [Variovorax soli]MDR6539322.1 hypothetical protein [Variovorax soli]
MGSNRVSHPQQSTFSLVKTLSGVLKSEKTDQPAGQETILVGKPDDKATGTIDGTERGNIIHISQRAKKHGVKGFLYTVSPRRIKDYYEAEAYLRKLVFSIDTSRPDQTYAALGIYQVLKASRPKHCIKMRDIEKDCQAIIDDVRKAGPENAVKAAHENVPGVSSDALTDFLRDIREMQATSDGKVGQNNGPESLHGALLNKIGGVNQHAKVLCKSLRAGELKLKRRSFTSKVSAADLPTKQENLISKIAGWPGLELEVQLGFFFQCAHAGDYDTLRYASHRILSTLAEQESTLQLAQMVLDEKFKSNRAEEVQDLKRSVEALIKSIEEPFSPFSKLRNLALAGFNFPYETAEAVARKQAELPKARTEPVTVAPGFELAPPPTSAPPELASQQPPGHDHTETPKANPQAKAAVEKVFNNSLNHVQSPRLPVQKVAIAGAGQPPNYSPPNGVLPPHGDPPLVGVPSKPKPDATVSSQLDPLAKAAVAALLGESHPSSQPAANISPNVSAAIPDGPPAPVGPPEDEPPPPSNVTPPLVNGSMVPGNLASPPNSPPPPLPVNWSPAHRDEIGKISDLEILQAIAEMNAKPRVLYPPREPFSGLGVARKEDVDGRIAAFSSKIASKVAAAAKRIERQLKNFGNGDRESKQIRMKKFEQRLIDDATRDARMVSAFSDAAGSSNESRLLVSERQETINLLYEQALNTKLSTPQAAVDEFVASDGGDLRSNSNENYFKRLVDQFDSHMHAFSPTLSESEGDDVNLRNNKLIDKVSAVRKLAGDIDRAIPHVFSQFEEKTKKFLIDRPALAFWKPEHFKEKEVMSFLAGSSAKNLIAVEDLFACIGNVEFFQRAADEVVQTLKRQFDMLVFLAHLLTDEEYIGIFPDEIRGSVREYGRLVQELAVAVLDPNAPLLALYRLAERARNSPSDARDVMYGLHAALTPPPPTDLPEPPPPELGPSPAELLPLPTAVPLPKPVETA